MSPYRIVSYLEVQYNTVQYSYMYSATRSCHILHADCCAGSSLYKYGENQESGKRIREKNEKKAKSKIEKSTACIHHNGTLSQLPERKAARAISAQAKKRCEKRK